MGSCLTGSYHILFRKLTLAIFPEITHELTTKNFGFCLTQADNGASGKDFERPAWLRLMEDIRTGRIAFPFNIDTFFTIIEPKFSISPTTSPTKKC